MSRGSTGTLLAALALAGCQAVLGIEDWEPRPTSDGGADAGGGMGALDGGQGGSSGAGAADAAGGTDGSVECAADFCVTELMSPATCAGTCRGTCTGSCSGVDAVGACAGSCDGDCQGTCIDSASAACQGSLECDAVADFGDPCSDAGQGACRGQASDQPLLCDGTGWTGVARCASGSLCDATPGPNAGTCLPVVPECAGQSGNDAVCRDLQVVTCGPDLVTVELGQACTAVTESCVDGACRTCLGRTLNCDADATDCEVDLDDVVTCGTSCGDLETCSAANGVPACSMGSCSTSSCDSGFADCGGDNDGCETDLTLPATCGTTCQDAVACVWPTPACDAGVCAGPPSCRGLPVTCGPNSNESCCASLPVTGGSFFRSYDGVSFGFTDQNSPAQVSDFRFDKYEVTVGRFRKFKVAWDAGWRPDVGAGKHSHLNGGSGLSEGAGNEPGWDATWTPNVTPNDISLGGCSASTWTSTAGTNDRRPMNCVNWYEMAAFCIWDGGFLPSEAEWNYAAAGGNEQRVYPWSNPATSTTIDCSLAVFFDTTTSMLCESTLTADVGSRSPMGDGKDGHTDLAGNVWEWALDANIAYVVPCTDCVSSLTGSSDAIIRGGSAGHVPGNLITSLRGSIDPAGRESDVGARCARVP